MPGAKAVIVVSVVALVYLLMPFIVNQDFILREFAYNRISNELGDDIMDVNSCAYLKEEQGAWLKIPDDVVDDTPFNDLVRGIGWCDQKCWLVQTILDRRGIKSRMVCSPTHTILEVGDRYLDPTYNRETTIIEGKYGDYYNGLHSLAGKTLSLYGRWYVDKWLDIYLSRFDGLYKARVLHIFGRYDEADSIYLSLLSTELRDQALYFLVTLELDRGRQVECGDMVDTGYYAFIPLYIERYKEVNQ